jgi:hypothetical protein
MKRRNKMDSMYPRWFDSSFACEPGYEETIVNGLSVAASGFTAMLCNSFDNQAQVNFVQNKGECFAFLGALTKGSEGKRYG